VANAHRPQLYKSIARVSYKPQLSFFERMYRAGQYLTDFPHWETDNLTIAMSDQIHRCSVTMNLRSLTYEQDSHDVQLEQTRCESVFGMPLALLEPDPIVELMHRRMYLIGVTMKFDDLADLLRIKLFSTNEDLQQCLPGRYADMRYQYEAMQENTRLYIDIAPVWKQQAEHLIPFNKARHLNPQSPEQDYVDNIPRIPPVSVYISVQAIRQEADPYNENHTPYAVLEPISIEEINLFMQTARQRSEQTVRQLCDYLFESRI
jgi:hypothetical protein